jgi:hypothetical protein
LSPDFQQQLNYNRAVSCGVFGYVSSHAVYCRCRKIEGLLADAGLTSRYLSHLSHDSVPVAWSEWHDDELERVEGYLGNARSGLSRMFSRIRQSAIRDVASRSTPSRRQ